MLRYWAYGYQNPTDSELAIEPAIAALGKRYRFQHPFFKLHHMADFALLDDKIIIEVDGASHSTNKQKLKDLKYRVALEAMGWRVMRCSNEEAQVRPKETVARLIAQAAHAIPLESQVADREIARLEALLPPKKPRKPRKPRAKKQKS